VTVKGNVPPVETVTATVLAGATIPATSAVTWDSLTKVVGLGSPSKETTDSSVKPEPFTVITNPAAPTAAVLGEIPPISLGVLVHKLGG
jgi:hypothetical protein